MLVRQPAPSDTQREQRSSSEGRLWLTLKFLVGKCWHSSLKCQSRCQLSFTIPSRYSTTDSPFHKRVQPCASRILTWIAFGVFCSCPSQRQIASRTPKFVARLTKQVRVFSTMADAMPIYQLRFFDAYSGKVALESTFDARDDEHAISEAESRRGLAPMELRRDTQVIRRWPPFPPSPPMFER